MLLCYEVKLVPSKPLIFVSRLVSPETLTFITILRLIYFNNSPIWHKVIKNLMFRDSFNYISSSIKLHVQIRVTVVANTWWEVAEFTVSPLVLSDT
jgi:hypothetical protein